MNSKLFAAIIIGIFSLAFLGLGIFALMGGSQEMFPAPEQQEKATIAGVILIIISSFLDLAAVILFRKWSSAKNSPPESKARQPGYAGN